MVYYQVELCFNDILILVPGSHVPYINTFFKLLNFILIDL